MEGIRSSSHRAEDGRAMFVSKIFWPNTLLECREHAYLVGWNLDNFNCCIVNVFPLPVGAHGDLERALKKVVTSTSYRGTQGSKNGSHPIILGQWFPRPLWPEHAPFVEHQGSGIWITLTEEIVAVEGTSQDIQRPKLVSLYSCGCRYNTYCYMFRYLPAKPFDFSFLSTDLPREFGYSHDLGSSRAKHKASYGDADISTDLERIVEQINHSDVLGSLVSEALAGLYCNILPPPESTTERATIAAFIDWLVVRLCWLSYVTAEYALLLIRNGTAAVRRASRVGSVVGEYSFIFYSVNHLKNRFEGIKTSFQIFAKLSRGAQTQSSLVRNNSWVYLWSVIVFTWIDLIVGCIVGYHLAKYSDHLVLFISNSASYVEDDIMIRAIGWFNRSPGGVKLNPELTAKLGECLLFGLIWFGRIVIMFSKVYKHVLYIVSDLGVLGFSMQLVTIVDILRISTYHIRIMQSTFTFLHRVLISVLSSLFYLFTGRKKNILRKRIDTGQYSPSQVVVGTTIFSICFFLLPTFCIYYTALSVAQMIILLACSFLLLLSSLWSSFPFFQFSLRFRYPDSLIRGLNISFAPDQVVVTHRRLFPPGGGHTAGPSAAPASRRRGSAAVATTSSVLAAAYNKNSNNNSSTATMTTTGASIRKSSLQSVLAADSSASKRLLGLSSAGASSPLRSAPPLSPATNNNNSSSSRRPSTLLSAAASRASTSDEKKKKFLRFADESGYRSTSGDDERVFSGTSLQSSSGKHTSSALTSVYGSTMEKDSSEAAAVAVPIRESTKSPSMYNKSSCASPDHAASISPIMAPSCPSPMENVGVDSSDSQDEEDDEDRPSEATVEKKYRPIDEYSFASLVSDEVVPESGDASASSTGLTVENTEVLLAGPDSAQQLSALRIDSGVCNARENSSEADSTSEAAGHTTSSPVAYGRYNGMLSITGKRLAGHTASSGAALPRVHANTSAAVHLQIVPQRTTYSRIVSNFIALWNNSVNRRIAVSILRSALHGFAMGTFSLNLRAFSELYRKAAGLPSVGSVSISDDDIIPSAGGETLFDYVGNAVRPDGDEQMNIDVPSVSTGSRADGWTYDGRNGRADTNSSSDGISSKGYRRAGSGNVKKRTSSSTGVLVHQDSDLESPVQSHENTIASPKEMRFQSIPGDSVSNMPNFSVFEALHMPSFWNSLIIDSGRESVNDSVDAKIINRKLLFRTLFTTQASCYILLVVGVVLLSKDAFLLIFKADYS
jgi:hypothetical protein